MEETRTQSGFTVAEENWVAYQSFLELSTQWNTIATMGDPPLIRTGLRYEAVHSYLTINYPDEVNDLFRSIRLMEIGALQAFQGNELNEVLDG